MMNMKSFVRAVIMLCVIACAASLQAQTMNHISSSGESEAATSQADTNNAPASGLRKYPDKPVASIPTQPVSLRYVVEHRSALNGKTITVRGIVIQMPRPPAASTSQGEQSMAFPQPRIFLADTTAKRRDKNYDLIVLLQEGERGYSAGQKVKLKVIVDASAVAVVLRKVY